MFKSQKRFLNLLEYQSKGLLEESGVAIQRFRVLEGGQDDLKVLDQFSNVNCLYKRFKNLLTFYYYLVEVPEYVVKAQILAGGRGKGHFSNGFKGGVHITKK